MRSFLRKFVGDERGYLPASEWALVASLLTLGTVLGLLALFNVWERETEPQPSGSGLEARSRTVAAPQRR